MRKIKCLSITLVFCIMTLFVAVCSSSASSKAVTTDPKETVIKAYQKFQSLKSYHMTIDLVSSVCWQGKNMNIIAKGDCDVQATPMLMKNTMNVIMDMGSTKIEQRFVQYMEEVDNQIIVYSNVDDRWTKQSMPNYNLLNEYDKYIDAITSVTLINEDANSIVFEVIESGSCLKENFERSLALTGMQNMQLTADLLKDLNDFKYTITVDKKTATISKIDMDLSDFISKIGNNIIGLQGFPDDQKKSIKEMLANMKITTTVTFSKINSGEIITIPQEAKNAIPNPLIQTKQSDTYPSQVMPPKRIVAPIVYPDEARRKGLEGRVLLKVTISDQGTVTATEIVKSSGYDILDNAAIDSVNQWRFSPAQKNGKAVTSIMTVPIQFKLANDVVSAEVKKIQQKLNELGFACGEPDGMMGSKTEQAIKDFQQSSGLEPDGIIGPKTKEALGI